MEVAIVLLVALAVIAFCFKWGRGIMNLIEALAVRSESAPVRVTMRRHNSDDEIARQYLAQLERANRAA